MSTIHQNSIKDYLYLVWMNPMDHSNYNVGRLYRSNGYIFEYTEDFSDLIKKTGVEPLHAFPDVDKKYTSVEMFPSFSSRLPDKKRRDISNILKKYGLDKYDEYELLRKGGGRLPIDTFEFIDPIFPDDEVVERDFYIMGTRYYSACNGEDCLKSNLLKAETELVLQQEPDNEYDSYAVQILDGKNLIGYVPRYYSQAVFSRIDKGSTYQCIITDVDAEGDCLHCVKVRLRMPRI